MRGRRGRRKGGGRGRGVLDTTDNSNVKSRLKKRRPKNALARHLVRLVERLEAERGFALASVCARTHRNEAADWPTREKVRDTLP